MSEVKDRLRVKAIKERAKLGDVLNLSNEDSEQLAYDFYVTVPIVWGKRKMFCEEMPFCTFKVKIKTGVLNDFTFRGMHIEWFCGDEPTFISPESAPIQTPPA